MLIGIDLGTTNSLVACFREGRAELIPNRLGSPLTPSVVSIDDDGKLYIGNAPVLEVADCPDRAVYVGVRPEGFLPAADGALVCGQKGIEVMGRDVSIVATHGAAEAPVIRAIISADQGLTPAAETVAFNLKPHKVFLFDRATEERVPFTAKGEG